MDDSPGSISHIINRGVSLVQVINRFIHETIWPSKELIIIIILALNIFYLTLHICAKLDQQIPEEFIQNLYKSHSCPFSSVFDWPLRAVTWERIKQMLNFTAN